jgi:polysaccharide biosynthesis/export protein
MKDNSRIISVYFLSFLIFLNSCGVNSSLMFKTPKGGEFKYSEIPSSSNEDYKISQDDKFTFTLSSNDGRKIIQTMVGIQIEGILSSSATSPMEFTVRSDGFVELPLLGDVYVKGLTVKSLQDTLVKKYANEYENPFVQVNISNKRVIVFPGEGGDAKVVPLINNNTTLMEAIASAGGISQRGRANHVKLMRMIDGQRQVYLIDLSTIEGIKYADMIVQANDYIYIEPNPNLIKEGLTQVMPFLSIFTTLLFSISILRTLTN